MNTSIRENQVIVMGGGLSGLSAAYSLTAAGRPVTVFESGNQVGGLSRTIVKDDFRFDLGGHRIFTSKPRIRALVEDLIGDELLVVPRKSEIVMRGRRFDYPLTPFNAVFGLGLSTTMNILRDYAAEKAGGRHSTEGCASLEDWVVRNFGRTMFNIYFKVYSEKVWGIPADRISADWVAQRIRGLSLGTAVKAAFFRFAGKRIPTLADRFTYPSRGIGQLSEALAERIRVSNVSNGSNRVVTDARVERLYHNGNRIELAAVRHGQVTRLMSGDHFVSSLPLAALVRMLSPRAPEGILAAVSRLRYRDLVVVAVMVNRSRVTDLTWLYIPEPDIPFGRIHEPTNWSPLMAPPGKSLLVAEYFCFQGDDVWRASDEDLVETTAEHLAHLGLVGAGEVAGGVVVRVPKAYPLFEVGFEADRTVVLEYLDRFENLHLIGRGGSFRYLNIDHALESGMEAAERILAVGGVHAMRGTA